MIEQDYTASQIANKLERDKQLISYYINKLEKLGYVKEKTRDVYKLLEITQAGKNFLDQYATSHSNDYHPICRLENIRFKAPICKVPSTGFPDWKKIEMNNWTQYSSQIDSIKIRLNKGKNPTIEFIPSPIDGDDPYSLRDKAFYGCIKAAEKLEEIIQIEIGIPEQSSSPEYVVYNPIAREFSRSLGQVRVEGIGKVNASRPRRIGEFEFNDPRAAAVFMDLPRRIVELEQKVESLSILRDRIEPKSEPILSKTDKLSQIRNKLGIYETTKMFDSNDFTGDRDVISH
jgi:DNA-binding MarR family transcriptional regulator